MKNLLTLDNNDLKSFFNSFDLILCDIDGVLWNVFEAIPHTQEAIESLKKIKKQIIYVTNNSTRTHDYLLNKLNNAGFPTKKDELITPIQVTVDYLKNKDLNSKKLFVIGMTPLKNALTEAGFQLAENMPFRATEELPVLFKMALSYDRDVSVLIVDVDINLHYPDMLGALAYLRRPEVEFLTGANDYGGPIGGGFIVPGPGYFNDIIEKASKRKGASMAKNGTYILDYMKKNVKNFDPKKVLIIGDSVLEDISFGCRMGCKTLLVFSGICPKGNIENWKYSEDLKPDFYVEHLGKLKEMIAQVFGV